MKRKLLLFLLVICMVQTGFAQTYNAMENYRPYEKGYIYLKNGDVIKGKYQYSANLDRVLIVTEKGTFVMEADQIEKISREKPSKQIEEKSETYAYLPKKYFNLTELGVLVGNPENTVRNPLVVHTSFNYAVDSRFSAGMGLGLEFYQETYLPVTANVMYKLPTGSRISPFVMVQGGYNLPISDTRMTTYQITNGTQLAPIDHYYYPYYSTEPLKTRGGFLVNPAVGFVYQINDGFGMGLSLGYRYHMLNYVSDTDYKLQVAYNRLSIKLGFMFN